MIIQDDYSFIGKDIRKIRESKGITRKEIADKMYISEETIRRIEKGENDPRLSTLVPLCDYLDIDLRDIINNREIEYSKLLSLRKEINDLLNSSSIEKASSLIKGLDEIQIKSNISHQRELSATKHYLNGLLGMKSNKIYINPKDELELALGDMNPNFKINMFKNYKYDQFSLRILLALAINEYKSGNTELYKDIMLEISGYLNNTLEDYFVFSYNIASFYTRTAKFKESLNLCNETIGNAKNIKDASYLNMLYYAKGINHIYLHQKKEAKESFNYCITLTKIFSGQELADSLSYHIKYLLKYYI